jgi:putative tricarboxylic transport membrane protein
MRTADIVTASLLMSLGCLVFYDAVRLGFGWGADGPQSGFFPAWLAIIMIGCCAVIMIQAMRKADTAPFVTREQLAPVLKVLWPATVAVALMHFIGLYVASAIYMAFYMRWVGRHSWLAVILISIGIPLGTFFVFELWFLVPMPKGPLETWLGY